MANLIDKSALIAKIKRLKNHYDSAAKEFGDEGYKDNVLMEQSKSTVCERVLSIIDTLEVKEVDLEREVNNWRHKHFHGRRDEEADGEYLERGSQYDLAKHFFELGLKARKGEIWKVVDNVNHPQADRNKIYCVFTKQQYILATVINHPQDEDLLQWKCTEFPFHRYDMCEGDKYMVIN